MAMVISLLLFLVALVQAKHLTPMRRSPTPKIDPKEYASALESANLTDVPQLEYVCDCTTAVRCGLMMCRLTPWPAAPYTVNFPGSRANALVFTDLRNSGTSIQTVALGSLLETLIGRLIARYPDPKYNVLAAVPDISGIGLKAFLFELRYTTPSSGGPAQQGSRDAMRTLHDQISQHGIKDLKAIIKIGSLNVGSLQVDTTNVPLLIPRSHLPLFVAVSSVPGPTIEITQLGKAYDEVFVESVFEATEEAMDYINARPAQAPFTSVEGRSTEVRSGKIVRFFLLAVGGEGFTNAAAAAVTAAMDDFLVDLPPGDMSFDVFEAKDEYRLLAEGRFSIPPGQQQGLGGSAANSISTA